MPILGCVKCQYLIPGCYTCSEVSWDSGILLDNIRLHGVYEDIGYVTCDRCEVDERFVEINLADYDINLLTMEGSIALDYTALDD